MVELVDVVEDFHILNRPILLAKYFIYKCKLNKIHLSLKVFIAKAKVIDQIKEKIAATSNKLIKYYNKWNKFLPRFS